MSASPSAGPRSHPGRPAAPVAGPAGVDAVMALLRQRGGRASGPRRVILEALLNAGEHRTAEELATDIHARHPDIHQATVYRTLDRLEELGVAYHTHLGHGPATWHLQETGAHQHLICDGCGVVTEADPTLVDDLRASLLDRYGFELDTHHFALTGTCGACAGRGAGRETRHGATG